MLTDTLRAAVIALVVFADPLTASGQPVRLTLAFEKPTAIPGEPVVAHVVVTNTASEAITLPAALEPEYGRLHFFVSGPGAEGGREFRPWATLDNEAPQELAPGANLPVPSKIFFGANGWTFAQLGIYRVRVSFGDVSSPVATLTVQEATSAAELEQGRMIIASREAGLFMLLEGGDHLTEGINVLRQVSMGQTSLSGYTNYVLGANRGQRFANLRTGQIRPANPVEAQQLLQRSRSLLPAQSLYFRFQSEQRLKEVMRAQGNVLGATQLEQQFQQELKDNILQQNLSLPLREFAKTAVQ